MGARLSVCIPTFNRPGLLREAVESCFRQERRPCEILIGDDSENTDSDDVIRAINAPSDIAVRYFRNDHRLGQSGNVNHLMSRAEGTHVTLLHDDDLFNDKGIDTLLENLEAHPNAACIYGFQQIIDEDGRSLEDLTERWNRRDRRVRSFAGPQTRPLQAALWCQPPNDAFLLRTEDAKRLGLASESLVGHAVDAHFMIEFAMTAASGSFILVPDYVSKYRLTPESIARSKSINGREDLFFFWLLSDGRLQGEQQARDELLSRISPGAALDAAHAGRKLDAFRIIMSSYYSMPWLSRWTGYRMMSILSPALGNWAKQVIDVNQTDRSGRN